MTVPEEHTDYHFGQVPHMPSFVVRARNKDGEMRYEYYGPKTEACVEGDMAMFYVRSYPDRFREVTAEEASVTLKTGVIA